MNPDDPKFSNEASCPECAAHACSMVVHGNSAVFWCENGHVVTWTREKEHARRFKLAYDFRAEPKEWGGPDL